LLDFAEPGLFEWLAWYQDGMPDWMSGEELVAAGYNIQLAYKPYISAEELQESTESCQQFYIRNFFVTQCALQVRHTVRPAERNKTSELIS
jgi:ubiquitin-associated SH3 domain-containing protein